MSKLSDKQERFCLEYIKDLNAAQAAIRAGYSPKGANSKGSQLLAIVSIAERIAELKQEVKEEIKFETKEWVKEHLKIVNTTPLDAMESTGAGFVFKDIDDFPEELRGSIKKISFKKGIGMEIELYNKQVSLDALGKWMGVYEKDNIQQQKDFTFNIRVKGSDEIEETEE